MCLISSTTSKTPLPFLSSFADLEIATTGIPSKTTATNRTARSLQSQTPGQLLQPARPLLRRPTLNNRGQWSIPSCLAPVQRECQSEASSQKAHQPQGGPRFQPWSLSQAPADCPRVAHCTQTHRSGDCLFQYGLHRAYRGYLCECLRYASKPLDAEVLTLCKAGEVPRIQYQIADVGHKVILGNVLYVKLA